MARLFIRHNPVVCEVEDGIQDQVFYIDEGILVDHLLHVDGPDNTDVTYVCFVRDGKCWAARSFRRMGNKQIRVGCVLFNSALGQEMILADMILN